MTGELPPSSALVKLVEDMILQGDIADWSLLRDEALNYGVICGGTTPRDHSGLPAWWEDYPKNFADPAIPPESHQRPTYEYNAIRHILKQGGCDLGLAVRPLHFISTSLSNTI